MFRAHCSALLVAALLCAATTASAEPPRETTGATATKAHTERPRRRAQKLDRARTAQERRTRVQVIDTVTVVGRGQRPLAVFDVNVEAFRFPVGTARYSPRDGRFVKRGR